MSVLFSPSPSSSSTSSSLSLPHLTPLLSSLQSILSTLRSLPKSNDFLSLSPSDRLNSLSSLLFSSREISRKIEEKIRENHSSPSSSNSLIDLIQSMGRNVEDAAMILIKKEKRNQWEGMQTTAISASSSSHPSESLSSSSSSSPSVSPELSSLMSNIHDDIAMIDELYNKYQHEKTLLLGRRNNSNNRNENENEIDNINTPHIDEQSQRIMIQIAMMKSLLSSPSPSPILTSSPISTLSSLHSLLSSSLSTLRSLLNSQYISYQLAPLSSFSTFSLSTKSSLFGGNQSFDSRMEGREVGRRIEEIEERMKNITGDDGGKGNSFDYTAMATMRENMTNGVEAHSDHPRSTKSAIFSTSRRFPNSHNEREGIENDKRKKQKYLFDKYSKLFKEEDWKRKMEKISTLQKLNIQRDEEIRKGIHEKFIQQEEEKEKQRRIISAIEGDREERIGPGEYEINNEIIEKRVPSASMGPDREVFLKREEEDGTNKYHEYIKEMTDGSTRRGPGYYDIEKGDTLIRPKTKMMAIMKEESSDVMQSEVMKRKRMMDRERERDLEMREKERQRQEEEGEGEMTESRLSHIPSTLIKPSLLSSPTKQFQRKKWLDGLHLSVSFERFEKIRKKREEIEIQRGEEERERRKNRDEKFRKTLKLKKILEWDEEADHRAMLNPSDTILSTTLRSKNYIYPPKEILVKSEKHRQSARRRAQNQLDKKRKLEEIINEKDEKYLKMKGEERKQMDNVEYQPFSKMRGRGLEEEKQEDGKGKEKGKGNDNNNNNNNDDDLFATEDHSSAAAASAPSQLSSSSSSSSSNPPSLPLTSTLPLSPSKFLRPSSPLTPTRGYQYLSSRTKGVSFSSLTQSRFHHGGMKGDHDTHHGDDDDSDDDVLLFDQMEGRRIDIQPNYNFIKPRIKGMGWTKPKKNERMGDNKQKGSDDEDENDNDHITLSDTEIDYPSILSTLSTHRAAPSFSFPKHSSSDHEYDSDDDILVMERGDFRTMGMNNQDEREGIMSKYKKKWGGKVYGKEREEWKREEEEKKRRREREEKEGRERKEKYDNDHKSNDEKILNDDILHSRHPIPDFSSSTAPRFYSPNDDDIEIQEEELFGLYQENGKSSLPGPGEYYDEEKERERSNGVGKGVVKWRKEKRSVKKNKVVKDIQSGSESDTEGDENNNDKSNKKSMVNMSRTTGRASSTEYDPNDDVDIATRDQYHHIVSSLSPSNSSSITKHRISSATISTLSERFSTYDDNGIEEDVEGKYDERDIEDRHGKMERKVKGGGGKWSERKGKVGESNQSGQKNGSPGPANDDPNGYESFDINSADGKVKHPKSSSSTFSHSSTSRFPDEWRRLHPEVSRHFATPFTNPPPLSPLSQDISFPTASRFPLTEDDKDHMAGIPVGERRRDGANFILEKGMADVINEEKHKGKWRESSLLTSQKGEDNKENQGQIVSDDPEFSLFQSKNHQFASSSRFPLSSQPLSPSAKTMSPSHSFIDGIQKGISWKGRDKNGIGSEGNDSDKNSNPSSINSSSLSSPNGNGIVFSTSPRFSRPLPPDENGPSLLPQQYSFSSLSSSAPRISSLSSLSTHSSDSSDSSSLLYPEYPKNAPKLPSFPLAKRSSPSLPSETINSPYYNGDISTMTAHAPHAIFGSEKRETILGGGKGGNVSLERNDEEGGNLFSFSSMGRSRPVASPSKKNAPSMTSTMHGISSHFQSKVPPLSLPFSLTKSSLPSSSPSLYDHSNNDLDLSMGEIDDIPTARTVESVMSEANVKDSARGKEEEKGKGKGNGIGKSQEEKVKVAEQKERKGLGISKGERKEAPLHAIQIKGKEKSNPSVMRTAAAAKVKILKKSSSSSSSSSLSPPSTDSFEEDLLRFSAAPSQPPSQSQSQSHGIEKKGKGKEEEKFKIKKLQVGGNINKSKREK